MFRGLFEQTARGRGNEGETQRQVQRQEGLRGALRQGRRRQVHGDLTARLRHAEARTPGRHTGRRHHRALYSQGVRHP